jgi:glycosyltransferase involved in cell wall biosynthesis
LNKIVILSGVNHPVKNPDIARRHDEYARVLSEKSKGQVELYSLALRSKSKRDLQLKFLKTIDCGAGKSFLRLIFFSVFWSLKQKRGEFPVLISSPDPFLLGFLAFLLGKSMLGRPKLQVQCHGDFGDKNWSKHSLKNWIFSKLAPITFSRANQIRCVGKNQAKKLIDNYKIDPSKIIIAPIPTKDKGDLPEWIKPTVPVVGFLGRLHKERSVDLWVQTAQEIFSVRNDVHFLIIGDGPERENFQSGLSSIPANQVSFVGNLPNEESLELLSKSSLLLSTAPFESFGMAMVEAAKIGLPIVSKPTSGALDLSECYDSIFLGNTSKELAKLTTAALEQRESGVVIVSQFLNSETESVSKIVTSWLELI